MYDYEILILFLLILFFFISWSNTHCRSSFVMYIDNFLCWLRKYYICLIEIVQDYYISFFRCAGFKLPTYEIPMFKPGCGGVKNPPPCNTCSSSGNVININCGGSNEIKKCDSPPREKDCTYVCGKFNEAVVGIYRYVLDVIPGVIYRYKIDCEMETKTTITHPYGVIKQIENRDGKLVLQDSYSQEHVLMVDSTNGNIIF